MLNPSVNTYPSHRALLSNENQKITAVMDCFSGLTLRVLPRRYPSGSIVETGGLTLTDMVTDVIDRKFWLVLRPATPQKARAMANRSKSANRTLHPGYWHEVISE
jgi:hypothetical protein